MKIVRSILRRARQFFYRTKVNSVSPKCTLYINYTLAKKWALLVVEKQLVSRVNSGRIAKAIEMPFGVICHLPHPYLRLVLGTMCQMGCSFSHGFDGKGQFWDRYGTVHCNLSYKENVAWVIPATRPFPKLLWDFLVN